MKKLIFILSIFTFLLMFNISNLKADELTLKDLVYTGSTEVYKSKDGILNNNIILDHIKESTIIDNKSLLTCNIQKDTFTGNGSELGDYELLLLLSAEGYNNLPLTLNIKVVDTFACDYFMNNTFYTSKRLTKVELLESMKAVNLCPNVNLNISFNSNYFEIDDEEIENYSIFICSYNYNSTTGYVDSGTFNIKQINQFSSDVIYTNNNDYIVIIISSIIVFGCIGAFFYLWYLMKKMKN